MSASALILVSVLVTGCKSLGYLMGLRHGYLYVIWICYGFFFTFRCRLGRRMSRLKLNVTKTILGTVMNQVSNLLLEHFPQKIGTKISYNIYISSRRIEISLFSSRHIKLSMFDFLPGNSEPFQAYSMSMGEWRSADGALLMWKRMASFCTNPTRLFDDKRRSFLIFLSRKFDSGIRLFFTECLLC